MREDSEKEIKAVIGQKFIVYDYDNNPVAKGWIMDAKEVLEKIETTCIADSKKGERTFAESVRTVITGDITHYPLEPHTTASKGILHYKYNSIWEWLIGQKTYEYKKL